MPSWWRKSSSKEVKKKENKESFIGTIMTIHRKLKSSSEDKFNCSSGGSRRRCRDTVSEMGSQSRALSPLTSTQVSRCQSFAERSQAQPLPLPRVQLSNIGGSDSAVTASPKPGSDPRPKQLLYVPVSSPGRILSGAVPADADSDIATASISSDSSTDSDDPLDSHLLSPMASDCEYGTRTALNSPSRVMQKDQFPNVNQKNTKETLKSANLLFNNQIMSTSPRRGPSWTHLQNMKIPYNGAFSSAPDSSLSSPSRSPMRVFGSDQVLISSFWAGKHYPDIASSHCSSPGSDHNSGHNSVGGDLSAQLFWQQNSCSPECSPIPSPRMTSPGPSSRMTSPGPSSRIQSGAVTPLRTFT